MQNFKIKKSHLFDLKELFYSDLNNESALVNYLSALKDNNNNNEFEMELVRYLDVLSVENRIKFSGRKGDIPSIKIFVEEENILLLKNFLILI